MTAGRTVSVIELRRRRVVTREDARRGHYLSISQVAEKYDVHPQTLRMYEREGLICPARTPGNTRLFDAETVERLEIVLNLTRELGVNLAGVEIILNMRSRLAEMTDRVDELLVALAQEVKERQEETRKKPGAIVHVPRGVLVCARIETFEE